MKPNWLLIIFFAVLAVFPIGAAIDAFVFQRCSPEILAEALKEKPDLGCAEFFFNRYQSLIGNLITATVTAATIFWAAKQLFAANRQAATASATVLRTRVNELEGALADVVRLEEVASRASGTISELSYNRDNDVFRANKAQIRQAWDEFREQRTRLRAWSRTSRAAHWHELLLVLLSRVDDVGMPLGHAFYTSFAMNDLNSITQDDLERFKRIHAVAKERFPKFFPATSNLRDAIEREIIATWAQIRKFESAAIDDSDGAP